MKDFIEPLSSLALEYVRNEGDHCVYCRDWGHRVERGGADLSVPNEVRVRCRCKSCKKEWFDVYQLVRVEPVIKEAG